MTATLTPTARERVIAALTENPGMTAKELGESGVTMNRLMKAEVVEHATTRRQTSGAGRPAIVYVLAGQEFDTEADERIHIEAATARLSAFRTYEAMSRAVLVAHDEYGYGSPEHVEAKANRKETFPVPPEIPSTNDYEIAGDSKVFTAKEMLDTTDDEGTEEAA